jgi:hypothetical protein
LTGSHHHLNLIFKTSIKEKGLGLVKKEAWAQWKKEV